MPGRIHELALAGQSVFAYCASALSSMDRVKAGLLPYASQPSVTGLLRLLTREWLLLIYLPLLPH